MEKQKTEMEQLFSTAPYVETEVEERKREKEIEERIDCGYNLAIDNFFDNDSARAELLYREE